MRYMMLMKPGIPDDAWTPSAEMVERMGRYNDELTKAGVLLALDGLVAPSQGARVRFEGGTATVLDGPFTETREVVGGYWLIDVPSLQDAVAWARRCPSHDGSEIEVRKVAELSDFPAEVQAALQHQ